MHKRFSFFIIFLLTAMVFQAGDHSAFYNGQRTPSSTAALDCLEIASTFIHQRRPELPVQKNSLFDKFPKLRKELLKTEFTSLEIPEFYATFVKEHGHAPTIRDALEYIYLVRKEIIASYDELIADVENMNHPALYSFVEELKASREKLNKFKNLDLYDEELYETSGSGKKKIKSIDETITTKNNEIETHYLSYLKERSREGSFYGELGELLAYGSSRDKPVKKGLRIETRNVADMIPYQKIIAAAVDKFELKLSQKTDQQLIDLVNLYGNGLLRGAKVYLDSAGERFDRTVLITKILTMIRTKEIDLVFQKVDGRYVWAEVKAYKKPITMDTLNGDGFKAKPMADQLREHIALRDLLGFKSSVDLRFITPISQMTPEAKAFVEKLGFEVVSAELSF